MLIDICIHFLFIITLLKILKELCSILFRVIYCNTIAQGSLSNASVEHSLGVKDSKIILVLFGCWNLLHSERKNFCYKLEASIVACLLDN